MSLFDKLKEGLFRSRKNTADKIDELVDSTKIVDDDFYEELCEIMVLSDMGARLADETIEKIKEKAKKEKIRDSVTVRNMLKDELISILDIPKPDLKWPMVQLIVGVNGVGKTTTIGKLALRFQNLGRTTMLVAADTFRAAASEQLTVWADRANVPIIKKEEGADPASVLYDAIRIAKSKNADLLLVDTAGRLHNKKNLMEEMNKLRRIIDREYSEATVRCMMVLDATTGQNGLNQAKAFSEFANINGVILTKMDGTAKGGIAVAIAKELNVPIMYVGVGEGIDDLQSFDAKDFVNALLGE
ncbi:MAG: signal recognition particle-docking protein FtsY [Eubacteriales bacterium]|nr:signal recognition particle-docking protein FtsY [Eubacteriales bacterium]